MKWLSVIRTNLPVGKKVGASRMPEPATGVSPAPVVTSAGGGKRGRQPTPFEAYRRRQLLHTLGIFHWVAGKSVLDAHCTAGDLLALAAGSQAKELFGVVAGGAAAVSGVAAQLAGRPVDLVPAEGTELPFPDQAFDVVLAVEPFGPVDGSARPEEIIPEWCRVSRQWVLVAVPLASGPDPDPPETAVRSLSWYKEHFRAQAFHLRSAQRLQVAVSARVFTGRGHPWLWARWLGSPLLYLFGFPRAWLRPPVGRTELPTSAWALYLQRKLLPLTAWLDGQIPGEADGTAVLRFERRQPFRRF